MTPIRPHRSVLYMPGTNTRALEKARTLPTDAVILDLEDAVAPEAKDAARKQVADAVAAKGFGHREVIMRINGVDTPWWIADVDAAARCHPDAILVPKVTEVTQLTTIADRLIDISADHAMRIWAMVESPLAVLNLQAIAQAAAKDTELRLAGFVLGTNDLAKETRMRLVPGRAPMQPWLSHCVLVAHAFGLTVLDGVYNDIADAAGFTQECAAARDMGFDGKTLIHPKQIEPCNTAFSPSEAEITEARRIIALFDAPENKGKGVVSLDGRMVERLHADMARRTVATADAIAQRG